MARNKRRARDNRRKRREAFTTEQYDVRSLHEEREYGLFWYAWLWKLIRPVMVFLCSVLIVVGMVTVAWNCGIWRVPRAGGFDERRGRLV